jgi:hypothetical protein
MAKESLEERVAVIEAQLAGKTLEEHFREQAEMIDERFAVLDAKWDARFQVMERDITTLKVDVSALKVDVGSLKKDMTIVREGMAVLLKRG